MVAQTPRRTGSRSRWRPLATGLALVAGLAATAAVHAGANDRQQCAVSCPAGTRLVGHGGAWTQARG